MKANARTKRQEPPSTDPDIKEEERRITWQRVLFWLSVMGLVIFLWIGGQSGQLFAVNEWESLVWLLPVIMFLVSVVLVKSPESPDFVPSALRTFFLFAAPLWLFVGLWLVIFSRVALVWWGTVSGNAVLGTSGWGLFSFALAVFLPAALYMVTIWSLLKKQFSVVFTLIVAFLTPFSFTLLLGLCIVVHRGW